MRPFDDIAVPAEVILALDIEGMPASDRALRNHANKNGWPVVYDKPKGGRALFLVDAIPQPFGNDIRAGLGRSRTPAPPPIEAFCTADTHSRRPLYLNRIMEARLLILFEVFRWSAYVGNPDAIRGVVDFARRGELSENVQAAIPQAMGNRVGGVLSYATLQRWISRFNKRGALGLIPGIDILKK